MAVNDYVSHIRLKDVVIADSATTITDGIDLHVDGKYVITGVYIPSGFDGTTLGFTTANTLAGTYLTVHTGAADLSLTVAASKYIAFDDATVARMKGLRFVKPVVGSQTGASTITLRLVDIAYV